MFYNGHGIEWCDQLNLEFDQAMLDEIGFRPYFDVLWADGKHELYCMGGEL